MKRHLKQGDKWLHAASWVWLLVFGSLGIGVLAHRPTSIGNDTRPGMRAASFDADRDSLARGFSTRSIEQIRVGDRVLASNPEVDDKERAGWAEPDWSRWLKLSLVMPKPDGSELAIEMLRSEEWLISQLRFVVDEPDADGAELSDSTEPLSSHGCTEDGAPAIAGRGLAPLRPIYHHLNSQFELARSLGLEVIGLAVEMDLPELGLTGDALLVNLELLPSVQSGTGRVVTATFHHTSGDVLDLTVEDDRGGSETLGTTSNHPFWSVDREAYVQAGELATGERVLTFSGDTKRVASKLPRPGPQPVFNLEVHAEHVYFVGEDGVLVHNVYKTLGKDGSYHYFSDAGKSISKKTYFAQRKAARTRAVNQPTSGSTEVILSRPHRNKTPGHWEAILDEVERMAASGDYVRVYANKGLRNEVPGIGINRRPDVWGVRRNGRIDQIEVPSKTDSLEGLIARMKDTRRLLGNRAGKVGTVPPKVLQ